MPGLFGIGAPATVALAVIVLAAVVVTALPSGRVMLSALAGSVARWPSLIRAELRGAAPLRVDGPGPGSPDEPGPERWDTTPDIPPVTRGMPVVERPDRV